MCEQVTVPVTQLSFPDHDRRAFEDNFPLNVDQLDNEAVAREFFIAVKQYLQRRWVEMQEV